MILIFIGTAVAVLLALLLWATGHSAANKQPPASLAALNFSCSHLQHLSQVRQAMDATDLDYLSVRFDASKLRGFKNERRQVVRKYLAGLRKDFEHLMEAAQVVASLSPEVEAKEEWKRFRLAAEFRVKYQIARAKFSVGAVSFSGVKELSNIVSALEIELEKVVGEISLRALAPNESGSLKS